MSPYNRKIKSEAKSPVVFALDVTGSMTDLVRAFASASLTIVDEIARNNYLDDPNFCVAAVGDVNFDRYGLQVGEFCKAASFGNWLAKVVIEGGGGGNAQESYELMAHFMANRCDIPNAVTPVCFFFADDKFENIIRSTTLTQYFGGSNVPTTAKEAFARLLEKFKGNVVVIRRHNQNSLANKAVFDQWAGVLGDGRVITLETDVAVGDIVIGVTALLSGSRTLEGYIGDLKSRSSVPSTTRVGEIRRALTPLDVLCEEKFGDKRGKSETVLETADVNIESEVLKLLASSEDVLKRKTELCSQIKEAEARLLDLKAKLNREDRKLAEFFYVRALVYAASSEELASLCANACLKFLARLPSETMEDCATSIVSIEGVPLPDFLDAETAKNRFKAAGIKLT